MRIDLSSISREVYTILFNSSVSRGEISLKESYESFCQKSLCLVILSSLFAAQNLTAHVLFERTAKFGSAKLRLDDARVIVVNKRAWRKTR